jgi:hypothetical protein
MKNVQMKIITEIDIDFSVRIDPKYYLLDQIIHYKGYRPSLEEFFALIRGKYLQDKIVQPEVLIPESYRTVKNNTDLDNRVKAFMRDNELTLCETFFPNAYGGFTYIVNYSFDDYTTFGLIAMDSASIQLL